MHVAADATAYPWRDATRHSILHSVGEAAGACGAGSQLFQMLKIYPGLSSTFGVPLNLTEDEFAKRSSANVETCVNLAETITNIVLSDKRYGGDVSKLEGYYNYLIPGEPPHWRQMYFGRNYPRLKQVKGMYDPLNVFGKPLTPETPF